MDTTVYRHSEVDLGSNWVYQYLYSIRDHSQYHLDLNIAVCQDENLRGRGSLKMTLIRSLKVTQCARRFVREPFLA